MAIPTQNPDYGFYGTIALSRPGCEEELWNLAIDGISKELGEMPSYIRPFLDSAAGRQFADSVINFLDGRSPEQAVTKAIKQWMTWKDSRILRNPIPSLVYSVHHAAIFEEEILGAY